MHSTHNEGKWVVAESFIKTLKAKIYKKWQLMIPYLVFWKKLVDQYNNTYHHSIN